MKVIVSVTGDPVTDQRVRRICGSLYEAGYGILLTGRNLPWSPSPDPLPYKVRRIRHFFNRGWLFYAEYNIRLFWFLLFEQYDILHSNDLDTLPANFLAGLIRRKKIVYDSHECFTRVPELEERKFVKGVWETAEKIMFPRVSRVITVSPGIARYYMDKYGKQAEIIRNVPEKTGYVQSASPLEFGLPAGRKIVIMQGTGINRERGGEEAVVAMKYVNREAILVIAGRGDALPRMKELARLNGLEERIFFIPAMPYRDLMRLTGICDAGLSLDRDSNLNYRYSLPNKLFDYIMAGIPVIASPLPEVGYIVEKYDVGLLIRDHSPEEIAGKINFMLFGTPGHSWKKNLDKASGELNWDNEKKILLRLYANIV